MNNKKYIKACIIASTLLSITITKTQSMITECQDDDKSEQTIVFTKEEQIVRSEQTIVFTKEEQIVRNAYDFLENNPKTASKTLCSINQKFKTCYSLKDLKSGSWCVFPDDEFIGITISGNQFFINYEGDWIKIPDDMLSTSRVIDVYGAFDS